MKTRIDQLKEWATTRMADAWEEWEPEIVDSMRAYFFQKLFEFERYSKITVAEVIGPFPDSNWHGFAAQVKFNVEPVKHDELTPEQFEELNSMRRALPAAEFEPRKHTGAVGTSHTVVRYSVLVTLRVGEITMSREYAL